MRRFENQVPGGSTGKSEFQEYSSYQTGQNTEMLNSSHKYTI